MSAAARHERENDYLQALQRALSKRRYYPASAQRRGLEGTVRVQFTIAADGSFGSIRVVGSSGSSQLDKAALTTVKRLARFDPIPTAIGRRNWTVVAPIVYKLR